MADVVIVGGGVIGCAAAYYLTQAGASVTLLERGEIGGAASGAAAGMVGNPGETPYTGPFGDLSQASSALFPSLVPAIQEETGVNVQYQSVDMLLVADSEERVRAWRAVVNSSSKLGLTLEWIDREPLLKLEPALSPALLGAARSPDQRHVNPGLLTQALGRAAAGRGAVLRQGATVARFLYRGREVVAIRISDGETIAGDHIVLAAGSWTGMLARRLNVDVPTKPMRGQMMAYRSTLVRHAVSFEDDYLMPKPGGFLFAGTTVEDVGFRPKTTRRGLAQLRRVARALVPALRYAEVASSWAGLRPGSPDGRPIIGALPGWENVYVATGHFRNGILLGPITGKLIAQLITEGRTEMPLEAFSPARFG